MSEIRGIFVWKCGIKRDILKPVGTVVFLK